MSTVPLQADETYHRHVVMRDLAGDLVPADTTPTAIVYRNGLATAITVTVTELSGPAEYAVSFVLPSDTLLTDAWQMLFTATISGTTTERWMQLTQGLFLSSVVYRGFTVRNSANEATPADSLPTVTVIRNNVDEVTAVTVTAIGSPTDGKYQFSFTIDPTWTLRDELQVRINAAVGGESIERLWYLGQIIDASALTVVVNDLIVLDDEQNILLSDDEQIIILACEP